jgi:hypothetical protein
MIVRRCSYCGQALPEFRLGCRLPDLKARIFDLVSRAGRDGIQGDDLFAAAYDDQPVRWKHERAKRNTLKAHVHGINSSIRRAGYQIVCSGRNASSLYRLERT